MSLIEADTVPIINNSQKTVQNRVYLTRWYILAVFSIVSALQVHKFYFELIWIFFLFISDLINTIFFQGMIWNSFGPISTSLLAVLCPHWTNATLALLGTIHILRNHFYGRGVFIKNIFPLLIPTKYHSRFFSLNHVIVRSMHWLYWGP
jgi:hypothetical protein